jgi:hypothetical protein
LTAGVGRSRPYCDPAGVIDAMQENGFCRFYEVFVDHLSCSLPVVVIVDYQNAAGGQAGKQVHELVSGRAVRGLRREHRGRRARAWRHHLMSGEKIRALNDAFRTTMTGGRVNDDRPASMRCPRT